MSLTVDERVEIGARFLDEHLADEACDWREVINLQTLDMSGFASCVLGQLLGWQQGVEALYEWSASQTLPDDEPLVEIAGFEKTDETYAELQRAWERVIEPQCECPDQDPWRAPVHYHPECPLNTTTTV